LALIHCIRDELARLGVKSRLSYDAGRTKANLFATLGQGKPAGIILSGHTDTVPWDGQDWSVDPLGGVVRDGRLYGRARVVARVRDLAEGLEREEPRYAGFDVPFSTASVGQFHGGIADNVVPRDAEFRYEFRDLPTADARAMQEQVVAYARSLEPAMQKVAPDTGFRFETICEVPSFLGSADGRPGAGAEPV
jgi:acetylornithine deacetylase/succinyl-diaminopimelate desuccinylase-like protein